MHSNATTKILARAGKVGAEKGVVQPRSRTMRDLKYGPASRLSQTVIPVLNPHSTSQHTKVNLQIRAFARRLIPTNDKLRQWNIMTDALGSKKINHIEELPMVF
jgi:hypothetical protein